MVVIIYQQVHGSQDNQHHLLVPGLQVCLLAPGKANQTIYG